MAAEPIEALDDEVGHTTRYKFLYDVVGKVPSVTIDSLLPIGGFLAWLYLHLVVML